jgi:hypothetical protein
MTCLTLLLKCLANGDNTLMIKLTSEYRQPTYFKCEGGQEHAVLRTAFVLGLLDGFEALFQNDNNGACQRLDSWLASTFQACVVLPKYVTQYADLFSFATVIEHLRWATLCSAMYIEGQKPKARRSALRSIQMIVGRLEVEYMSILNALSSVVLDCQPAVQNELVHTRVLANWKQSIGTFKAVLELTGLIVADLKLPQAN